MIKRCGVDRAGTRSACRKVGPRSRDRFSTTLNGRSIVDVPLSLPQFTLMDVVPMSLPAQRDSRKGAVFPSVVL